MKELRLVPTALLCWCAAGCVVVGWWPLGVGLVAVASLAALSREQTRGQGLVIASTGGAVLLAAWRHVVRVRTFVVPRTWEGDVDKLSRTRAGGAVYHVRAEGMPITVFAREQVDAPRLAITGTPRASPRGLTVQAEHVVGLPAPPSWRAEVHAQLRELVGTSEGADLIPGMVLGDTTLQTHVEQARYAATGLSHLTAVSGANVALVTTTAVLLCRALTLGPRVQIAAAAGALAVYVVVVGTEPSVLRAAVMGVVGLVAFWSSRRMEPVHALCVAVITLLLCQPGLAVEYGFALSVAATAGIVALHPLLYARLAWLRWPDALTRALSVAIAADLVTMPIIAAMTGRISVVAVVANVLVAPVVAPITVVGLAATCTAATPLGGMLVALIEPLAWWIAVVARTLARVPALAVGGPLAVAWLALGWAWVVALLVVRRTRLAAGLVATVLVCAVAGGFWRFPPGAFPPGAFPPGAFWLRGEPAVQWPEPLVVSGPGPPSSRPTLTREGVPVLYPDRDGEVVFYPDGSIHAASGIF